jgi:hypothetical protein
MGYGLDGLGSVPGRDKIFVSTPHRSDRFWSPISLLSNRNRGILALSQSRQDVKLTTHLRVVPRSLSHISARCGAYLIKHKENFTFISYLCGLVVRVPGYRSRGPGSIPGSTGFSEK